MRRGLAILTLLTCALLCVPAPPARAGTVRADDGAHVTDVTYRNARTVDLTIGSPALGRDGHARVLLPSGHRRAPHRASPVLYLLHGCCDNAPGWKMWTDETDIAAFTRHSGAMVVMPEAAPAGFYSNWWNHGRHGPPAWETFHLTELRQILERGWHAGTRRAIAGLSMGGFGALSYAARHRDLFRAAASFSGLADARAWAPGIEALLTAYGDDPQALWGDPALQKRVWKAHNPYDLMPRLRGLPLYVACGNGRPGPLDPPGTAPDAGETGIGHLNERFVAKAHRLHLPLRAELYGPGTHSWPYWQRDLHHAWPMLARALGAHAGVTG